MAHEVETMMYAGEVPWHGLGKRVTRLQTSAEAIGAAGLDWGVELVPIFTQVGKGSEKVFKQAPDCQAVRRDKDLKVLGIVGPEYQPIQNSEAFQFFDGVIGEKKAIFETAGSLRGGKKIWIMANMKGSIGIKGDEVKKYLVLFNSHDGSLALQIFYSPIRVVCMNTLRMALERATQSFYVRHTSGAMERIEAAREVLGLANKFYDQWKKDMQRLAVLQLPAPKVPLMLKAAFQQPDSIRMEDVYNPTRIQMEKVQELIEVDRKEFPKELHGTAYEAYNAVVKYTDYYRQYRGDGNDTRLRGVWFGSGAQIKNRAYDYLVTMK